MFTLVIQLQIPQWCKHFVRTRETAEASSSSSPHRQSRHIGRTFTTSADALATGGQPEENIVLYLS